MAGAVSVIAPSPGQIDRQLILASLPYLAKRQAKSPGIRAKPVRPPFNRRFHHLPGTLVDRHPVSVAARGAF
jgi:hypothetical protein